MRLHYKVYLYYSIYLLILVNQICMANARVIMPDLPYIYEIYIVKWPNFYCFLLFLRYPISDAMCYVTNLHQQEKQERELSTGTRRAITFSVKTVCCIYYMFFVRSLLHNNNNKAFYPKQFQC
ncbi:hypothetical protein ACJX0J_037116, partial [Zea mays]